MISEDRGAEAEVAFGSREGSPERGEGGEPIKTSLSFPPGLVPSLSRGYIHLLLLLDPPPPLPGEREIRAQVPIFSAKGAKKAGGGGGAKAGKAQLFSALNSPRLLQSSLSPFPLFWFIKMYIFLASKTFRNFARQAYVRCCGAQSEKHFLIATLSLDLMNFVVGSSLLAKRGRGEVKLFSLLLQRLF